MVFLNVYQICSLPLGYGLYHTAVEYDGVEYSFGVVNNNSGVYEMKPKTNNVGVFIKSIQLGCKTRREFFIGVEKIVKCYNKKSYNLLTNNCNHFTNDYLKNEFGKEIPSEFQSFLKLGEMLRM